MTFFVVGIAVKSLPLSALVGHVIAGAVVSGGRVVVVAVLVGVGALDVLLVALGDLVAVDVGLFVAVCVLAGCVVGVVVVVCVDVFGCVVDWLGVVADELMVPGVDCPVL